MSTVKLANLTQPDLIVDIATATKTEALSELLIAISQSDVVTDPRTFARAVFDREKLTTTAIGHGVAVPHAKIPSIRNYVMAIGRSREGVDFDSPDGLPVHLLFLVGAMDRQAAAFVQVLASIVTMVKNADLRERLLSAPDGAAVYQILIDWDQASDR